MFQFIFSDLFIQLKAEVALDEAIALDTPAPSEDQLVSGMKDEDTTTAASFKSKESLGSSLTSAFLRENLNRPANAQKESYAKQVCTNCCC